MPGRAFHKAEGHMGKGFAFVGLYMMSAISQFVGIGLNRDGGALSFEI